MHLHRVYAPRAATPSLHVRAARQYGLFRRPLEDAELVQKIRRFVAAQR